MFSEIKNFSLPFALGGEFCIEGNFAMQELFNYLNDLQALQAGVSAQELYADRRADAKRSVYVPVTETINGSDAVYWVEDEKWTTPNSIAVLKLQGTMQMNGACGGGVSSIISDLEFIESNKNILGSVIKVRSGGGDSFAGSQLFQAIKNSKKPIVALVETSASAAVMATLGCDEIIAKNEDVRFGSVGTYVMMDNKTLKYLQEKVTFVYAEKSALKNEEMNAIIRGDFSILKKEINKSNDVFVQRCQSFRGIPDEQGALEGRMFDAKKAKELNFFDAYGSMESAFKRVQFYSKMGRNKRK